MHEEKWEVERKFTICAVLPFYFRAKSARGGAEGRRSVNNFALRFSASREKKGHTNQKGERAIIIIVPMIAKTILI